MEYVIFHQSVFCHLTKLFFKGKVSPLFIFICIRYLGFYAAIAVNSNFLWELLLLLSPLSISIGDWTKIQRWGSAPMRTIIYPKWIIGLYIGWIGGLSGVHRPEPLFSYITKTQQRTPRRHFECSSSLLML
jgi:hypothetical protein